MASGRSHCPHVLPWSLVLGALLAAAPTAWGIDVAPGLVPGATVPWHASLADAKQAAQISHRPVLVIFTAAANESGAALARDVFPAAETVALLTACFEPVQVDVDVDPTTARGMGITSVPTACIIDERDRLLASFECPTTAAAFVAAASRATQEAATARASGMVTPAAVVREQSDFVNRAAPPTAQSAPATQPAPDAAPTDEPALPAAPPAWPAEPAGRPMPFTGDQLTTRGARPSLDPAAAAGGAAPWLGATAGTPSQAGQAVGPPAATTAAPPQAATVASSPATPTLPTATPGDDKKPASSSFFAALQKPFGMFTKPKTAATDPPATPAPVAAASAPQAAGPDPYGSMPLGLEGYCPVTLVDKGVWVEGRAQWGARHRGRTYLFASAEQQRAFLADPDRYAPALSGDDPVLACDSGRQVAGQRRYGVSYQARTYLFSSPETRAAFAANPQRYTTRVMIAERPSASDTIVR